MATEDVIVKAVEGITEVSVQVHWWDMPIIGYFISAAVIIVLSLQVYEFKKQTKLAHDPFLAPRIGITQKDHVVQISNVGNGVALNVNIKIFDKSGKNELGKIKALALKDGEAKNSDVSFNTNRQVTITGTYTNINKKDRKLEPIIVDYNDTQMYASKDSKSLT